MRAWSTAPSTGRAAPRRCRLASISGGRLVLTPTQGSLPALSIDLPQIVDGITYRKVRIEGDTATLTFTLRKATFKINGS